MSILNPITMYGLNQNQNQNLYIRHNNRLCFILSPHFNNFIFSPCSLSTILYSLYFGMKGHTKTQFIKIFKLPQKIKLYKDMVKIIPKLYQISSFLINRDINIKKSFVMKTQYLSEIYNVNFTTNIKDKINTWVNSKVNIRNIIPDQIINSNSCIILLNALSFTKKFKYKFNKIEDNLFYPQNKPARVVQMMYLNNSLNYYSNSEYQQVELPYVKQDYYFGIILSKNNNLPIFNFDKLKKQNVSLVLPSFKLKHKIDFKSYLTTLGMSFNNLNLKGITDDRVTISNIIHETSIIVEDNGMQICNIPGIKMNCDTPFIYYIRFNKLIIIYGQFNEYI